MKRKSLILLGLLGLLVALMPAAVFASTSMATQTPPHIPHVLFQQGQNHNHNQLDNRLNPTGTVSSSNLAYRGGPVMAGTMNVYLIFWQPTGSNSINQDLIENYFTDVGSSALYQIAQQYPDSQGHFPSGSQLAGTWMDMSAYPNSGTSTLYDSDIQNEVTRAQQANHWTSSIDTMFFVFTEKNEDICYKDSQGKLAGCTPSQKYLQQNLPSYFCAYHSYFDADTIYAAMPYAASFGNHCNPEIGNGFLPSGQYEDMTINLASHEQMEAATDPLLNAWLDTQDNEIGDKCAWTFGPLNNYGGDVNWNGDMEFLLQQEWSNAVSSCIMSTSTTRQYYQIVDRKDGLVMSIAGASTNSGAQVIQATNHHGHSQEWYLVPNGNTYQLVNRNSGQVLTVAGASTSTGANLIQSPNHNGGSQKWQLAPEGEYDVLLNVKSLKVARPVGGSTTAGARIVQDTFTGGSTSEEWTLVPVIPQTYFVFKNVNSGLVMDISGGSTSAGAHVVQWPSNGSSSQEWGVRFGQSMYWFVNRKSGLTLTVSGASTSSGTQIIQATDSGALNQRWQPLPSSTDCWSGNTCQLQNVNSNLVLAISGGSKAQGANVVQESNQNSLSQQWIVIPVTVV